MTVPRYFQLADGVAISAEVEAVLHRIAGSFHLATGKPLFVTSGTRTPASQAAAMYVLLSKGSDLSLYKDQAAAQAIRTLFLAGQQAEQDKAQILAAMTAALEEQVNQGTYLSQHLTGRAVDIRNRDMTPQEKATFEQIARGFAALVLEEEIPPHYHLQF